MKSIKNIVAVLLAIPFVSLVSCGFYEAGENSVGDQSLSATPVSLTFEGEAGQTYLRTVNFKNRSQEAMVINNMAFVGDLPCRGEFSLYNVLDESGNVLFKQGESINVTVAAGKQIDINVRFSPVYCEEDSVQMVIYFKEGATQKTAVANFSTVVEQGAKGVECDAETTTVVYKDSINDPTVPRALNEKTTYYFRVDTIRSYIQPPGAFTNYAIQIGTDYNIASIPEDDRFKSIYLPITSDGEGNLTLEEISPCANFALPTPITDTFMRGASAILSSDGVSGTVSESGELNFKNFGATLYAAINNSQSLIQSDDGEFQITINMDLTTSKTIVNESLANITDLTSDSGDQFLSIISDSDGSKMEGDNLWHGTVRLVGVGTFTDEGDGFIGSSIAQEALLGTEPAYLFIEIIGRVVYGETAAE